MRTLLVAQESTIDFKSALSSYSTKDFAVDLPRLTSQHIQRCFNLRYDNSIATCFIHCHQEKAAFVTAAHVVKNAVTGDKILIKRKNLWNSFTVGQIEKNTDADVAVFALQEFSVSGVWKENEVAALLGHPTIYLGFAHQLCGDYPDQNEFVTPLAKVAHFS